MDVRGDAHVVTLCQRCNARNEITVSDGQVVEPATPTVDSSPRVVT